MINLQAYHTPLEPAKPVLDSETVAVVHSALKYAAGDYKSFQGIARRLYEQAEKKNQQHPMDVLIRLVMPDGNEMIKQLACLNNLAPQVARVAEPVSLLFREVVK
jgi:hypothetical protein